MYKRQYLSKIIAGKTTEQDILNLFGKPQGMSKEGNKKLYNYSFSRAKMIGLSTDSGAFTLGIFFKDGIVEKYVTDSFGNYKQGK